MILGKIESTWQPNKILHLLLKFKIIPDEPLWSAYAEINASTKMIL
jgi:hypothetical protein